MVKKIKIHHKCNIHGHKPVLLCKIMTGIRKKTTVLEIPGEPNVEIIWNYLLQCAVCKILMTPEIPKENLPSGKESESTLPILQ